MARTVAEIVKELEQLKHRRAVWMEMVEHLSKSIDQEVQPAQQAIVAEGCVISPVPQSVIREFIDDINESEIDPLNETIDDLEVMGVKETNNDEPESPKPARSKAKKETKVRPKAVQAGKRIRAVPKPSGSARRDAKGAS